MLRWTKRLMKLALITSLLLLVWIQTPAPAPHPTGPTIQHIQQLAALVTTRVEIADVQETRISGVTGDSVRSDASKVHSQARRCVRLHLDQY